MTVGYAEGSLSSDTQAAKPPAIAILSMDKSVLTIESAVDNSKATERRGLLPLGYPQHA